MQMLPSSNVNKRNVCKLSQHAIIDALWSVAACSNVLWGSVNSGIHREEAINSRSCMQSSTLHSMLHTPHFHSTMHIHTARSTRVKSPARFVCHITYKLLSGGLPFARWLLVTAFMQYSMSILQHCIFLACP